MRPGRALMVVLIASFTAASIVLLARPFARAAAFIGRTAGVQGWSGRLASWDARPFAESSLSVPIRTGMTPARLYKPARESRRAVVLASGVHPAGIHETRLVHLARELAASGLTVLTPELPDLARYAIAPASVDILEDAARWLADQRDLSPDRAVGMMGISFAGGLSIVAAGRPSLRGHVAFVFALGGHGDLPRVLRYLCTGLEPGASFRKPHDYGLAVVLMGVADDVVPAEQATPLREAVRTFLEASALDPVRPDEARQVFERARVMEAALPEPAATLMHEVNARNVQALGPRLLPHVDAFGGNPALSPERSPAPDAPVFLLHGTDDNVIPPEEAVHLAAYLSRTTAVRTLLSGLITHAEVDHPPSLSEARQLIAFWTDLFAQ